MCPCGRAWDWSDRKSEGGDSTWLRRKRRRQAAFAARAHARPRSAPGPHFPLPVGHSAPGEKPAQKRPRRGACPSVRSWAENRFPGTCRVGWAGRRALPATGSAPPGVRGGGGGHQDGILLLASYTGAWAALLELSPPASPPSRREPSPCPFCPGCRDARDQRRQLL